MDRRSGNALDMESDGFPLRNKKRNFDRGHPCVQNSVATASDEQLRFSFCSENTQIVGNKRGLFAVANLRPNAVFRTFDSPLAEISPQIERTCAVRPSQIPFSGEFSTPESRLAVGAIPAAFRIFSVVFLGVKLYIIHGGEYG